MHSYNRYRYLNGVRLIFVDLLLKPCPHLFKLSPTLIIFCRSSIRKLSLIFLGGVCVCDHQLGGWGVGCGGGLGSDRQISLAIYL